MWWVSGVECRGVGIGWWSGVVVVVGMISEVEEIMVFLVVGRGSVVGRRVGKGSEGGVWEGGVVGCVFYYFWVGYIGGF